ncbi:MAG TPA: ATP synthase F1 subunit delta [Phycisphaerales bacterium]|nr:ATP synthase F1 subunit delta [Phycisphaerales bacterium]
MPLIESQPDALANVYARSLLELAEEQGGQERIESVLGQLEDLLEMARADKTFGEFLASRVLTTVGRAASLRRILDGRVDDLVLRFLLVLNEKGRLGHIAAIVAAYDAQVQSRFGRIEVDVFTAAPVDVSELAGIKSRLAAILGKDVVVHPYTDESMIGGIKLRIGDQLVDASIASRLRRMRDRLHAAGGAEIRARAPRIIDSAGE